MAWPMTQTTKHDNFSRRGNV